MVTTKSTTVRSLLQTAIGIKDNKLLTDLSVKCYGSLVVLEECLVDEESLLKLVHAIHERYEEEQKVDVSCKFWCRTFIMRLLYLSDWYVLKIDEEGSVDWSNFSRAEFVAFYREAQQHSPRKSTSTTSRENSTGERVAEEGVSAAAMGGVGSCAESVSASPEGPSNEDIADLVMNGEIHFVSDSFPSADQEDQHTPSLADTSLSMSSPVSKLSRESYADVGDYSHSRLAEATRSFCELTDDNGHASPSNASKKHRLGGILDMTAREKKRQEEITVCFQQPKGLWEDAWADTDDSTENFFDATGTVEVAMSSQMPVDERPAKMITA